MKCPQCGHDMGKRAKCLRCGYTSKGVIPIDPEKIEKEREQKTERREIHPDDVHISRAGGGGIFGGLFGGSIFGGLEDLLSGFFGEFDDGDNGYEYDPKYYDSFGNEIHVPDEFERKSVEIREVELLEESVDKQDKKHKRKHRKDRH